jgi:hypothetical protein
MGSVGVAPNTLDLSTILRCVTTFTPRPLYFRGKSPDTHSNRASAEYYSLNKNVHSTMLFDYITRSEQKALLQMI